MLSAFVSLSGQPGSPTVLLYSCEWKDTSSLADFSFEGVEPVLSSDGLRIVEPGGLIRLNRYYSLAERTVRYHVRLDSGCRAVFRSDQGDFKAYVDMASKSVSMATDPVVETVAGFLTPGHEYLVFIFRQLQSLLHAMRHLASSGLEFQIPGNNDIPPVRQCPTDRLERLPSH